MVDNSGRDGSHIEIRSFGRFRPPWRIAARRRLHDLTQGYARHCIHHRYPIGWRTCHKPNGVFLYSSNPDAQDRHAPAGYG